MTSTDARPRKLDLGRVFGDTFGVVRRQAGPLLGVTLVVGYLPGLVISFASRQLIGAPSAAAPFQLLSNPLYWAIVPLNLLLTTFLLACQLQIAIGDLEGANLPLSDLMRRAFGKILPLIGAVILMVLSATVGGLFLFVPGVIVALMWSVALPSTMADTSNPIRALDRSRALTKGNRWRIFGLVLLAWLVVTVVEVVMLGALGGASALTQGRPPGMLSLAMISLISFLIYIVSTVGSAALYVQLRELKGVGGESVAQVFA